MADWNYPALPTVDAPVTAEWGATVQENPVALAEGAAGAPRVLAAAIGDWYFTAGGVKTYVWAVSTAISVDFGAVVAGSTLRPTSGVYRTNSITGDISFPTGNPLTGSWRCMGVFTRDVINPSGNIYGASIFVRVS